MPAEAPVTSATFAVSVMAISVGAPYSTAWASFAYPDSRQLSSAPGEPGVLPAQAWRGQQPRRSGGSRPL